MLLLTEPVHLSQHLNEVIYRPMATNFSSLITFWPFIPCYRIKAFRYRVQGANPHLNDHYDTRTMETGLRVEAGGFERKNEVSNLIYF